MAKPKSKKEVKKTSWLIKVFRFFFPKDWKTEMMKGRMAGEQMRQGKISPKVVPTYWLGKGIRKAVDPEHKLKVGEQKEKKK